MKNIFTRYPYLYLLLFCFGGLIIGFEISEIIENGFPIDKIDLYLSLSGLIFNSILIVYFLYCFVKIKNNQVKK